MLVLNEHIIWLDISSKRKTICCMCLLANLMHIMSVTVIKHRQTDRQTDKLLISNKVHRLLVLRACFSLPLFYIVRTVQLSILLFRAFAYLVLLLVTISVCTRVQKAFSEGEVKDIYHISTISLYLCIDCSILNVEHISLREVVTE